MIREVSPLRRWLGVCVLLLVLWFILGALAGMALPAIFNAIVSLLFGWMVASVRLLSGVRAEWRTVLLVFVGLCLAVLLAHFFASWFVSARAKLTGQTLAWPFRRTCMVLGSLMAIACAAMAITGAVHQTAWAATSEEEWLIDISYRKGRPAMLAMNLRHAAVEADGDIERAVGFVEMIHPSPVIDPRKRYRVSYIAGTDGRLTGIVMTDHPLAMKELWSTWVMDCVAWKLDRIETTQLGSEVERLSETQYKGFPPRAPKDGEPREPRAEPARP